MNPSSVSRRSFLSASATGALATGSPLPVGNQVGGIVDALEDLFEPPGTPVFVFVRTVDCNGDRTEARFTSFETEFAQLYAGQPVQHAPLEPYEIREGEYAIKVHHGGPHDGLSTGNHFFDVAAHLECPDGSGNRQEVSHRRARLTEAQDPDALFEWLTGLSNVTDWRYLARFVLGIATRTNLPSGFTGPDTIMYVGQIELQCDCHRDDPETTGGDDEGTTGGDGGDTTGGDGPSEEAVEDLEERTAALESCLDRCAELREELEAARQRLEDNLDRQRRNRERIEELQAELADLHEDDRIWIYQNTDTGELVYHAGERFEPTPPLEFKGSMLPRDAIDRIESVEAELDAARDRRADLRAREQERRAEVDRLADELEACERECERLREAAEEAAERVRNGLEDSDGTGESGETSHPDAERALREFEEVSEAETHTRSVVQPPIAPPPRDRHRLESGMAIHAALNWRFLGIDPAGDVAGLAAERGGGYLFVHPSTPESVPAPFDLPALVSSGGRSGEERSGPSRFARERLNGYYTYGEDSVGLVGVDVREDGTVDLVPGGFERPTLDAHVDALTIYLVAYSEQPGVAARRAWEAGLVRVRGRTAATTVSTGVSAFLRDVGRVVAGVVDAVGGLLGGLLG